MTPQNFTDDPDSPHEPIDEDPKCPHCGGETVKYDDRGTVYWKCEKEDCEAEFGYHQD